MQRLAWLERVDDELDLPAHELSEAPSARLEASLDADAGEVSLEGGQEHLIEILVRQRPRDVGAARDVEPYRRAVVVCRVEKEGEDGLEDEQRAGGRRFGCDADLSRLQVPWLYLWSELERVAADSEAGSFRRRSFGKPRDGGDVL